MRFQAIILTLLLSALAFQQLGHVSRCLKKEVLALKSAGKADDHSKTDQDFNSNASSCKTSFNYIIDPVEADSWKPTIYKGYEKPVNTELKQSTFSFNIYSPPRFTDLL